MPASTPGAFVGRSLLAVDGASVAHVPGLVATVVIRDFVGVVADREEHAVEAGRRLQVSWRSRPRTPPRPPPGSPSRSASVP